MGLQTLFEFYKIYFRYLLERRQPPYWLYDSGMALHFGDSIKILPYFAIHIFVILRKILNKFHYKLKLKWFEKSKLPRLTYLLKFLSI